MISIIDKISPRMKAANCKIDRYLIFAFALMFIYGLSIAEEWEFFMGFFSRPISWAANHIPSIVKMAKVSENPGVVKGFYGFSFFVSIFLSAFIFYKDAVNDRLVFLLSSFGGSSLKALLFVFFIGLPFVFVLLFTLFFLPISIDMKANTRAVIFITKMINDRIFMAFFGGVLTLAVACFLWFIFLMIYCPIFLLFNRE